MAFYRDGTAFVYSDGALPGAINVGWLSRFWFYRKGRAKSEFVEELKKKCFDNRAIEHRGFHYCPLCPPWWSSGKKIPELLDEDRIVNLGSTVLSITHPDGTVFATADLIYHYVTVHRYLPPKKFIKATLNEKK